MRRGRAPLAGAASTRPPTAAGGPATTARAPTCARMRRTRARDPIELCIRVPICGKTPPITDDSLKGEKRLSALTDMKAQRLSREAGETRQPRRTTGLPCDGNPSAKPARTPPLKTRASIPLAHSPRVKTRIEAIAQRYRT